MKKSILNIGKALDKKQQQQINGGFGANCQTAQDCADAFNANSGLPPLPVDVFTCFNPGFGPGHCSFSNGGL